MTMTSVKLPAWLSSAAAENGIVHLSQPRRYAHDETGYDAYYDSDPANFRVGKGLVHLLVSRHADTSGPALEVGCGTGLVSLGLAQATRYPVTVFTDPSPAFLEITRAKIRKHGVDAPGLAFAVLMGEELNRLPEGELSLIVLRSTLHHVLHVEDFIAAAARALRPGGVLTFQEPCMEGYVLMGAMAQFLPELASAGGTELTPAQREKVELFANSMAFYSRRDVDKSAAEDKHLFRVDEIMAAGARCGLSVDFLPNTVYEAFENPARSHAPDAFGPFFRGYARFCMAWDDDLMALFDRYLLPKCRFVEQAAAGGSGPYLHGVFICTRRN
jgi:ubiquinone/menaquinone biosynthesis C-methylase UbiE